MAIISEELSCPAFGNDLGERLVVSTIPWDWYSECPAGNASRAHVGRAAFHIVAALQTLSCASNDRPWVTGPSLGPSTVQSHYVQVLLRVGCTNVMVSVNYTLAPLI